MKTLYLFLLMLPALAWGQKNLDFLSSTELIEKGLENYKGERYYEAIQEYRKVSINDTNYAAAQYEMARSYMGMEEYKSAQNVVIDLLGYDLRFDFKHKAYSLLGNAYNKNGETEKALETYTEGIRLFPMQPTLYFNRGLAYENAKAYDKALDDYKQAIQCNIYHASSHLRLGIMAAHEGMYTQATLSLITFLLLEPTDSRAGEVVGLLEGIANGSFEEEPKHIELSPEGDIYEELNLFYKNKVALQKNYKVKLTVSTSYARQLDLILKNTNYKEENLDFWNQHYLPFLQSVRDNKKFDQLIMLTLINLDNDDVQSKLKSKVPQIKDFVEWAATNFKATTSRQYMEFEGKKQFVYVEYEPKYFSGYGKMYDGKTPTGTFYYYHPNGSKRMVAHFDDKGDASGTWDLYNMYNGNIERKIEFVTPTTKKQSDYYFSGDLHKRYTLIDGLAEDTVYSYYRNGTLKEKYAITKSEKNGLYQSFYPNGTLEYSVQYTADEVNGPLTSYHLNGQKAEEYTATAGKVNGKDLQYYANGQLSSDYTYENGLYSGPYTEYFADGKVKEKGTYKAGKRVGEMTEYHSNGEISNTIVLDENGKENGNSIYYDYDGKKYHELLFAKGNLTKILFYDKAGTATEVATKKGKKMDYILNYPNGTTKIRGQYLDADRDGKWEYFDRYGNLELVEHFKAGEIVDTVVRYYSNGQLKSVTQYADGEKNGMFLAYNIFGELTDEGFYKNGDYDRDWYSYYADGSISSENYFVDGVKNGIQKNYAVNGKIASWENYDVGRIVSHVFLDTNENVADEYGEYNGTVELHNPINSFVNYRAEYKNGNADGPIQWMRPDNQIEVKGAFTNSERTGDWKWYFPNGKPEQEVTYLNGDKHGTEKIYFENGKLSSEQTYSEGDLQGPFKYYNENGTVKTSGTYLDDDRHGKVTYYSPEGSISMYRNYDKGVIISYTYLDKEGKEVAPVSLDKQELQFVTHFKNGNKSNVHTRRNGLIEGTYTSYHENGQKWEEESYLHGESHGKTLEYNEAGQKILEADYLFGDLHGKKITYYATGRIQSEEAYLFGQLHGKSIEYAPDGKITSITLYYNNEIVSIQKF